MSKQRRLFENRFRRSIVLTWGLVYCQRWAPERIDEVQQMTLVIAS